MPKPDRLAGLTEEEVELDQLMEKIQQEVNDVFEDGQEIDCTTVQAVLDRVKQYRESLSACRASEARLKKLLKKHEWLEVNIGAHCLECGAMYDDTKDDSYYYDDSVARKTIIIGKGRLHAPDCALAAELEGGE